MTARYLEIDGKPYVMELIQTLDDSDSKIENAIDSQGESGRRSVL